MHENHVREPEERDLIDAPAAVDPNPCEKPMPDDVHNTFERMEGLLKKIHDALDTRAREEEHRDWSYGRTAGMILQVIVAGLVVLALIDWILYGPINTLIIQLAFAGVLQLTALTAFLISGKRE